MTHHSADGGLGEGPAAVFDDVVPVLRRTFARFEASERKVLGRHVRRLGGGTGGSADDPATAEHAALDPARADRVLPRLAELIGAGLIGAGLIGAGLTGPGLTGSGWVGSGRVGAGERAGEGT